MPTQEKGKHRRPDKSLGSIFGIPGKYLCSLDAQKTALGDGTILIYGRAQRLEAGALTIYFDHKFSDPKTIIVQVTPNFDKQAGFIETVTRIEHDCFTVVSNNSHYSDSFITWIVIGK
jgi:hypothetical protein